MKLAVWYFRDCKFFAGIFFRTDLFFYVLIGTFFIGGGRVWVEG